ncbi:MAG: transporter, partial [Ilumatobacteraceae bacterium]|nr:transporter [Ilumatobacteraceae bacterium]
MTSRVDRKSRTARPDPDDGMVHVVGARQHNLRDVDVDVPRNALVAFTGVSGSGKSSLAFGTIYAESQRRYLESVAPYARRLIHQLEAADVDEIRGLPPAVALQQQRGTPTTRSTVGTLTTISNLVRMLFFRAGTYPAGSTERLGADAFSPNTANGACTVCDGLGTTMAASEALMVPDTSLTIREGAVAAWPKAWQGVNLRDIVTELGHDVDIAWSRLPKRTRDWILFTDEQPVVLVHPARERNEIEYNGRFWSARAHIMHTLATTKSEMMRARAMRFVERVVCPTCGGSGLRAAALAVTFAGRSIDDVNHLTLSDLSEVLRPDTDSEVAATLTADIAARVDILLDLGLGYLSLGRTTPTLSPGEMQRLRLATQLRSGLFGVVYVLDEPSAGLHPADAEPLLDVLQQLRENGNTLFVVEHDMDVVRRAEWVVDVGPGAGDLGGRVLYSGPVDGLRAVDTSITRRYLFTPPRRFHASPRTPSGWLRLDRVTRNNLRDVTAEFPLGCLTAVTGVSGSGKSTLVRHVLAPAIAAHLGVVHDTDDDGDAPVAGEVRSSTIDHNHSAVSGHESISRIVVVDQRPIGRTPRSNIATYTGLFDAVRKAFAATPESIRRGYTAGRFSFNVAEGRCSTCQGEGFVAVELLFLPGTYEQCPTCRGGRYNPETLEITWQDATIADVLSMSVDRSMEFFGALPGVERSLRTLHEVGLGYVRIGQPATELSGGEAQRVKLASELQRAQRGHTLYVLDEPTSGLHPADVELLMHQLHRLVDAGNTVVAVEHDMDVIANADWVIDLGPGGGSNGGTIVAVGTPDTLARAMGSLTAPYLAA